MAQASEGAKVVSANRLDTGEVVWLGEGDLWVERVAAATLLRGSAAEAALARAKTAVADGVVVDPYLVDVDEAGGGPLRPRERIRARGPSVRPDLGVQADSDPLYSGGP